MNTAALKSGGLHTGPLAPARLIGVYFTETCCEFLRTLRNPALALPVTVLPLALYLLFAVVISGDGIASDPPLGVFLFAAFAVMAVTMPALFAISASLAMEREMGLTRLRRAQPAPPGSWLVAKIVCGIVFCALAYLPLLAAAIFTGKLPLPAVRIAWMSLVLIAGSIPFCALGLMVGALVKGSAAPGYANLIYLPGCYLSGMFFPLPASMHWQTPFWPQFHLNQLAMHAAGVTKFQFLPVQLALAGLVGFTVIFSAVALWRLARRE